MESIPTRMMHTDQTEAPAAAEAAPSRTTAPAELAPTTPDERVAFWDVLRGMALFGVFVDNVLRWTSGYDMLSSAQRQALPTWPADRVAMALLNAFAGQRIMALFAFLFGLGLAMQLLRAEEAGVNPRRVLMRRLAATFVIGAAHLALLFYGEIVMCYALVGTIVIVARRWTVPRLLAVGIALALFEPLAWVAFVKLAPVMSHGAFAPGAALAASAATATAAAKAQFVRPSVSAVVAGNLQLVRLIWSRWMWPSWIPLVVGVFLLGLAAGRSGVPRLVDRGRERWRLVFGWCAAIALLGCIPPLVIELTNTASAVPRDVIGMIRVLMYVGIPAMAAAYVAGLVLLFQRAAWRRRLVIFAPTGRMSLTNYLVQSLFGVVLFYGVGFRQFGRLGAAPLVGITVAFFTVQVAFSRWWLARWAFGPAEWLWRSLAYGKMQPLRVRAPRRVLATT